MTYHTLIQVLWGHIWKRTVKKSPNKCNQCYFSSSCKSALRTHLRTHIGEMLNNSNQCDFASSYTSALRTYLKKHSRENSNKCNQCDFASSQAGNLRTHLKTHSGEKPNKCTNVTLHPLDQTLWGHIWKYTVEKVKQMQRMWVCILSSRRFEETFWNTHRVLIPHTQLSGWGLLFFCVHMGLCAAKITLWAFDIHDHFNRKIAPLRGPSFKSFINFGQK